MPKPPAFQMYASDFLVDTNDWTVDEVGIYLRLLLSEWVNGGLPNNEKRLSRIAGCDYQKFKKKWFRVGGKFKLNGGGFLVNERLEFEREKQDKYRELQSEKGRMGGRPLKSRSFSGALTEQKPEESSSSSSSSLNLNKTLSQNFDKFWQAYPLRDGKRVTKKESLLYFKDHFKDEEIFQLLMKATLNYCNSTKDRFVKDPIRFLKKDFWKDWIEEPIRQDDQYSHFEIVGAKNGK